MSDKGPGSVAKVIFDEVKKAFDELTAELKKKTEEKPQLFPIDQIEELLKSHGMTINDSSYSIGGEGDWSVYLKGTDRPR